MLLRKSKMPATIRKIEKKIREPVEHRGGTPRSASVDSFGEFAVLKDSCIKRLFL